MNIKAHGQVKAIIFDLGGVLLRTIDQQPRENLARQLGITRKQLEEMIFSSPSSVLCEEGKISWLEHCHFLADSIHVKLEECLEIAEIFFGSDQINNELLEFVLRLDPKVKVGLLSNAWQATRSRINKTHAGFLNQFDEVLFSAEVGLRKPDPQIYRMILSKLQVRPEESIFIDDFRENVIGAKAIGMLAIHYRNNADAISELSKLVLPSESDDPV